MGRYPIRWNRQAARAAVLALVAFGLVPASVRAEALPWPAIPAAGVPLDLAGLERLAQDFPDSGAVRLRLLNAYLEAERPADALREAAALAKRGHLFSPAAQDLIESLGPTDEQRVYLALQTAWAMVDEASEAVAEVPAEVRLVESVWRDPGSGDLFVTSVVSRGLYVQRKGGAWTRVPLENVGSLSGLAFDPASGLLWIASGVFEPTPDPDTAFRGVIALDPVTGTERRRLAAAPGATPSDLAVGKDGAIYASDPVSGAVYRAGAERLEVLVPAGTFRSPQGIAPLPDGRTLIVSDYGYGLARVDLATGAVRRMTATVPVRLDGIDGLWLKGNRLIGVQNGSRPMRIVALTLSEDGTAISAYRQHEAGHRAWTEPVGGSLEAGALLYVATGQWDRFGAGGAPSSERPPIATQLRFLPLAKD